MQCSHTSVTIVHPSSHIDPRLLLPWTSEGSIVKQSPGFMVPSSLLSIASAIRFQLENLELVMHKRAGDDIQYGKAGEEAYQSAGYPVARESSAQSHVRRIGRSQRSHVAAQSHCSSVTRTRRLRLSTLHQKRGWKRARRTHSIALPIPLSFLPGPQARMPSSSASFVASVRFCPSLSASGSRKVADVSPW